MHFGSEYLKKKVGHSTVIGSSLDRYSNSHNQVVRDVLQGDKVICLAITEPYAGR